MLGKLLLSIIATVAVVAAAFSPAIQPDATTATTPLDAEEQTFMSLINQYRQQNGLGTLSIDPSLDAATEWMSTDMGVNNFFSHTDSLGRDPFQRMRDFGYDYNTWMGENIAAGTGSAQTAFELWKNSPGHNANMLNPNYKVMGIARAYGAGSTYFWYWTNDFGGYLVPIPSATPSPSPTPAPNVDSDGDGFANAVESHVGTNPNDPCGNPDLARADAPSLAWPADLSGVNGSANVIDLLDLGSFVAPVRRLGTSRGDAAFDQRWDLAPGRGALSDDINLMDLMKLVTSAPPILGSQRAFNGPQCPNP